MNDRELYTLLWHDLLREAIKDLSLDSSSTWHIDLLGSGSAEDTYQYLKYYADDAYGDSGQQTFLLTRCPNTRGCLLTVIAIYRRRVIGSKRMWKMVK